MGGFPEQEAKGIDPERTQREGQREAKDMKGLLVMKPRGILTGLITFIVDGINLSHEKPEGVRHF